MKDVMEKMEEIEQDAEELRQEYEDEDGEDSEEEDGDEIRKDKRKRKKLDEMKLIDTETSKRADKYRIEYDGDEYVVTQRLHGKDPFRTMKKVVDDDTTEDVDDDTAELLVKKIYE